MQLTWLTGAPSRPVSVHWRVVGRVGFGSAATQLMRAVRPLDIVERGYTFMAFDERLIALGQLDSLEAERLFQSLRTDIQGREAAIVARLETESNDQSRRYLLALLGESESDTALRALRSHVHDKDLGARSWARYGVGRITGERFQEDYRDIEEAEARLVIYPDRWRVYLVGGTMAILLFGILWTTASLVFVWLGWASGAALAERIASGWFSAVLLGLIQMVIGGERYRTQHRILVNEETIVGPKRNEKIAQISPDGVRMTEYQGGNWLLRALRTWTLQGEASEVIEVHTMWYRATDISRLKQTILP